MSNFIDEDYGLPRSEVSIPMPPVKPPKLVRGRIHGYKIQINELKTLGQIFMCSVSAESPMGNRHDSFGIVTFQSDEDIDRCVDNARLDAIAKLKDLDTYGLGDEPVNATKITDTIAIVRVKGQGEEAARYQKTFHLPQDASNIIDILGNELSNIDSVVWNGHEVVYREGWNARLLDRAIAALPIDESSFLKKLASLNEKQQETLLNLVTQLAGCSEAKLPEGKNLEEVSEQILRQFVSSLDGEMVVALKEIAEERVRMEFCDD